MTADLLTTVVAAARRAADERERSGLRAQTETAVERRPPQGTRFRESLRANGIRVIAECKRRSPSRGVLRRDYDPVSIAAGYAAAGAAAISILTEPTFFDGSLDHLRAVRAAVDTPLLRKDFIVTEFQLVEAAAAGADAALLIVAALDDRALRNLLSHARALGLAALVEVHSADELDRALGVGADIIGVNSRNLRTLEVDRSVFDELGPLMPRDVVAIAESGLKTAEDLRRLHAARYDAFLIGERFMSMSDPAHALAGLIAEASAEADA